MYQNLFVELAISISQGANLYVMDIRK